jgi:hypothetical protein
MLQGHVSIALLLYCAIETQRNRDALYSAIALLARWRCSAASTASLLRCFNSFSIALLQQLLDCAASTASLLRCFRNSAASL